MCWPVLRVGGAPQAILRNIETAVDELPEVAIHSPRNEVDRREIESSLGDCVV